MAEYEDFRREVLLELAKSFSGSDLINAISAVDAVAANYKIDCKVQAMIPASQLTEEAVNLYLASLGVEGRVGGTLMNRRYRLTKFFTTVRLPLNMVTTNDIRAFLYTLKQDVSDATLEKYRTTINSFFEFCVSEEIIQKNPCKKIRGIRCEKPLIKPLSDSELNALIGGCVTVYEEALVRFLYSTGARIQEAANVRMTDIDFTNRKVKLFGKGRKERLANLSDAAVELIENYIRSRNSDSEYLFSGERRHRADCKISTYSLRRTIQRVAKRAGITVNPHQIRHTTATNLQKTMPIQQISKYLGHANISTTMIYAEIAQAEIDKNFNRCMNGA